MTLYIVGTPIGNLEDMTFRAVRILQSVDRIAAEDTRHTAKLLQHFQITTPQISYHQHNRQSRLPQLLSLLQQGKDIALVCDAGMPTISDPGLEVIQEAIAAAIPVIPIPGVTAVTTALAVAGLNTDRFVFEGFLPTKNKLRQARLQDIARESRTLIFYEAPHRLISTLTDLAATCGGDRPIVLTRELTKLHEDIWRGSIAEAINHSQGQPPLGEYTLVMAGLNLDTLPHLDEKQLKQELDRLLAQGMSLTQASRELVPFTALSRREIYQLGVASRK